MSCTEKFQIICVNTLPFRILHITYHFKFEMCVILSFQRIEPKKGGKSVTLQWRNFKNKHYLNHMIKVKLNSDVACYSTYPFHDEVKMTLYLCCPPFQNAEP